jgi:hypothetical protein
MWNLTTLALNLELTQPLNSSRKSAHLFALKNKKTIGGASFESKEVALRVFDSVVAEGKCSFMRNGVHVKWEPKLVKLSDGGVLPEDYGNQILHHSAIIASPLDTYDWHITLPDGLISTLEVGVSSPSAPCPLRDAEPLSSRAVPGDLKRRREKDESLTEKKKAKKAKKDSKPEQSKKDTKAEKDKKNSKAEEAEKDRKVEKNGWAGVTTILTLGQLVKVDWYQVVFV